MGELHYLDAWRTNRTLRNGSARAEFYFDLGCPQSYLAAERVERTLGAVVWIPASAATVQGRISAASPAVARERADARAGALRLPLVWPERFPAPTPCALRAAVHAAEIGVGARFALAASRLAFCGGFDLEDPEMLAEAGAASGVPLDDCLRSAGDEALDDQLAGTARMLRNRGVRELPAFRVGDRWFDGESGLLAAAYALHRPDRGQQPAAPRLV
jgi:2-hydroxychromene-2-carboxylate isomerase